MRKSLITLTVVPLLLLAACSGGETGPDGSATPATTVSGQPVATAASDDTHNGASATTSPETTEAGTPTHAATTGPAGDCASSDDDLVIRDGEVCELDGAVIGGNLEIERGGTLVANEVTVDGDVQGEGHAAVTFVDGRVGGNIQLNGGGAATVTGTDVDGDIQSEDNTGAQEFSGNTIDGNLQCEGNDPAPTGGGNVVAGDAEDQCAALA
ncbi:hypothetical protein [Tessaracoccus rhinocerotis]|uniref:hypothetical protein n=1 Tax=Tessaracoccus rhinocerotis TaxID=1689449 RepID=UPI00163DCC66|nr:hypothetical protein [Tessaracoccus rhinocerotis]